MNNQTRLKEYLLNNNGKISYSEIKKKFNWKANYLSEIIKKLGSNVKRQKFSISGKNQMGGKRFEYYLILVTKEKIGRTKPEVQIPKVRTTEVQYKPIKEKIDVPIKINGNIDLKKNLNSKELLEEIRKVNFKVFTRLNKKDKYILDTINTSLENLLKYEKPGE